MNKQGNSQRVEVNLKKTQQQLEINLLSVLAQIKDFKDYLKMQVIKT